MADDAGSINTQEAVIRKTDGQPVALINLDCEGRRFTVSSPVTGDPFIGQSLMLFTDPSNNQLFVSIVISDIHYPDELRGQPEFRFVTPDDKEFDDVPIRHSELS